MALHHKYVSVQIANQNLTQQIDEQFLEGTKGQLLCKYFNSLHRSQLGRKAYTC